MHPQSKEAALRLTTLQLKDEANAIESMVELLIKDNLPDDQLDAAKTAIDAAKAAIALAASSLKAIDAANRECAFF